MAAAGCGPCAPPEPPLPRLRRRLRRHGRLRQARLRRRRDRRDAARRPLPAGRRRCSGLSCSRAARRAICAPRRRDVGVGLALGGCGYAIQAGCYFAALERIDASLLSLLLYTFPAIVAAAASPSDASGSTAGDSPRWCWRRAGSCSSWPAPGPALSIRSARRSGSAAALVYSAYILVSQGIAARLRPRVLSALVCTGAAASPDRRLGAARRAAPGEVTAAGWGWLACLALVSTVAAIGLFFAGLRRVGPTTASILATVEPLVTVLLAFFVFGETLGRRAARGRRLVLAAVLALQARPAARPTGRSLEDERHEQTIGGQGRAGRGATRGGGPRHRGRARRGGRHGLRHRAQHPRAALGDRPAGDDRGDRRARHRGGRGGHRGRGRPPRPGQVAAWSSASTPITAASTCS